MRRVLCGDPPLQVLDADLEDIIRRGGLAEILLVDGDGLAKFPQVFVAAANIVEQCRLLRVGVGRLEMPEGFTVGPPGVECGAKLVLLLGEVEVFCLGGARHDHDKEEDDIEDPRKAVSHVRDRKVIGAFCLDVLKFKAHFEENGAA